MNFLKRSLGLFVVGLTSEIGNKLQGTLMMLLVILLMVAGCASPNGTPPNWPSNLNVTVLSDGGVCFDKESAARLSDFKTQLERW